MGKSAFEQAASARAILLDWDGCVFERGALKPGARAFLRAFADKISILSNNSTDAPDQLAAILARAGAAIPPARIHLAGQVALESAAVGYAARPLFLIANASMTRVALSLGLTLGPAPRYDAVVLLRDTRFTYRKLEQSVRQLRRGAALIVANPDLTHPSADDVAPETGALLAAIGACVDLATLDMTIVGKPSALLYERAIRAVGVSPPEALMIGDNPLTDIRGAQDLGIPAVLLGSSAGMSLASIMADGAETSIDEEAVPNRNLPGCPSGALGI